VEAHDGVDVIGRGTHERFVIDRQRFSEKVYRKAASKTGREP
jgi:fluoroacetyl-CoA thioesterase